MKYFFAIALLLWSGFGLGQNLGWRLQHLPTGVPSDEDLVEVVALDSMAAVALGKYNVYKTSDGGTTWRVIQAVPFNGKGMSFSDKRHGWIGAGGGQAYVTLNGGESWQAQNTHTNYDIVDISFVDSLTGYALTAQPRIIRTSDGGLNWQTAPAQVEAQAIHFTDLGTGFALGLNNDIMRTTNGSNAWARYGTIPSNGARNRYGSLFFLDTQHGWATEQYSVLRTSNGGRTWTRHATGTDTNMIYGEVLGHVHFTDTLNGWAAGRAGLIHTTDGGRTWAQNLVIPRLTWLNSVHLSDARHGWAVGGSQIYKLADTTLVTANRAPADPKKAGILLYPNPSPGHFKLLLPAAAPVAVFNLIGARVASPGELAAGTHALDLSPYGKGIYLIRIGTGNRTTILKAIVR